MFVPRVSPDLVARLVGTKLLYETTENVLVQVSSRLVHHLVGYHGTTKPGPRTNVCC